MTRDTAAVRRGEELNVGALADYLTGKLEGADGGVEVEQFAGGHSNLTYLIRCGGNEYVLRRAPLGPVAPKAHDMSREFRILQAVSPYFPEAPRPYLVCEDPSVLGAVFFVMTKAGKLLLKNPPPGYRPPGWEPKPGAATGKADIPTRDMLKTPTFYALWIAYCLGATAGLMVISQLVPFARNSGLTATQATLAITVCAFGNAAGRILSGWMSDAFGRLPTLRIMVLASALAMPVFFLVREQLLPFYLLTAVVYWCYGTQLSVFASTTADLYGTKHLGMNYGVLFTAWGAAGILGPAIAARAFVRFGSYRYAFFAASAMALVALVSLSMAKPPLRTATS